MAGTEVATVKATPVAPSEIQWEQEIRGAQFLYKSGLVPAGVKSPEAALFIILTGRDLGMSAVQSLRSIHVIQGKIEVSADAQLGLFHGRGGQSKWLTLTNELAVIELHAPWLLAPHRESFSKDDASRAKLGGDNWSKYPKAMLRSRAITAGLKSIGFDATAGTYAPGELGGDADVDGLSGEVVVPTAAPEQATEDKPTNEQFAFLGKLLNSHVWTPQDREVYATRGDASASVKVMSDLIEEVVTEGKKRKAAEKVQKAPEPKAPEPAPVIADDDII